MSPQTRPVSSHTPATLACAPFGLSGTESGRRRQACVVAEHKLPGLLLALGACRVARDELPLSVRDGKRHLFDACEKHRLRAGRAQSHPAIEESPERFKAKVAAAPRARSSGNSKARFIKI